MSRGIPLTKNADSGVAKKCPSQFGKGRDVSGGVQWCAFIKLHAWVLGLPLAHAGTTLHRGAVPESSVFWADPSLLWNPKRQTAHLSCVWHSVWEARDFVCNLIHKEMSLSKHNFSLCNKIKLLNTLPSPCLPFLTHLFDWLSPTGWWLTFPPWWYVWQYFWVSLGNS